ncbi:MAG TPA: peptidoglycan-binding protein [Afifellaceae bacterium]|nr:peptidoglycan-binding protein [Afifellaceae bacterium]
MPAAPILAVGPADAENAVGRFFNKVGDAIVNNPLNKRSKRRSHGTSNPAAANEPDFDRQTRRALQDGLNALGYDVGKADGLFGPATRRGIADFQTTIGATPSGFLTREQADHILAAVPANDQDTGGGETAASERRKGPADGTIREIAGPEAVWAPAAIASCTTDEILSCMERFGAPEAAVAFVRFLGETGEAVGLLSDFDDFGNVDIAAVRYLQTKRAPALVLVNGGPAAISTENDAVRKLSLDDPVYRRLVSRFGELKLIEEPRLESHRLMTHGEQRFMFAYRLAKCPTCATPGEVLVAYDFDPSGRYKGLSALGIASRDPDRDWQAVSTYDADALIAEPAALQRRLAGLGFDAGPLDGNPGRKLEAALKELQSEHGMKQTGEISDRSARLLAEPDIIVEVSRFEQIFRIATEPDIIEFALRYGLGVLSRASDVLPANHEVLARMNSRIARLYDRSEAYANALPYARDAVTVSRAAGLEKSQDHGILLFNLGETYRNLGRTQEAAEQFDAAFEVFEPLAVANRGRSSRNLAAQALERTGQKLITLYEDQGREWSAKRVQHRLETVESQLSTVE